MKYELERLGKFIRRPLLLAMLICTGLLLVPALYRYNFKAQTRGNSRCSEGWYIDVFTDMGRAAEEETFRITSNNNRVCFTSK